jgi:hypothetical protein
MESTHRGNFPGRMIVTNTKFEAVQPHKIMKSAAQKARGVLHVKREPPLIDTNPMELVEHDSDRISLSASVGPFRNS